MHRRGFFGRLMACGLGWLGVGGVAKASEGFTGMLLPGAVSVFKGGILIKTDPRPTQKACNSLMPKCFTRYCAFYTCGKCVLTTQRDSTKMQVSYSFGWPRKTNIDWDALQRESLCPFVYQCPDTGRAFEVQPSMFYSDPFAVSCEWMANVKEV